MAQNCWSSCHLELIGRYKIYNDIYICIYIYICVPVCVFSSMCSDLLLVWGKVDNLRMWRAYPIKVGSTVRESKMGSCLCLVRPWVLKRVHAQIFYLAVKAQNETQKKLAKSTKLLGSKTSMGLGSDSAAETRIQKLMGCHVHFSLAYSWCWGARRQLGGNRVWAW